jgi:predicted Zn-dependent protease
MPTAALTNFLKLLESGRDSALLRYAIANEYLKTGESVLAAEHLRAAVRHDPNYSAAWKLLGRALEQTGELQKASDAYAEGVRVAESKGDKQAAREMAVFARRLQKKLES